MGNLVNNFIAWLANTKILTIPRIYTKRVLDAIFANADLMLIASEHHKAPEIYNLIRKIKKETIMLLSDFEAYQICRAVQKTEKIAGDIVEVGVYRGGSAKIICETTKKAVHLFDTFDGLPNLCEKDSPQQFSAQFYTAFYADVIDYLKEYSHASLYKGFFPETAEVVKDKKFSFVHLDVDIYQSTLDCLDFFYSRMSKGGMIISHDYPKALGVKRAIDEFFSDKPELIIELPGTNQCLIVKM